MVTKDFGSEISWTLGNCEGSSYSSHSVYESTCCLEDGTYELNCMDAYGDGWNNGYLEIDGSQFCGDFNGNSWKEIIHFPSEKILSPTQGSSCVVLEMTSKHYGSENTWTLGHCSGGPYVSYTTVQEECCLDGGSYELTCVDAYGDGWNGGYLSIGGVAYCEDFTSGHSTTREIVIESVYESATLFSVLELINDNPLLMLSITASLFITFLCFQGFSFRRKQYSSLFTQEQMEEEI